MNPYEVLGVSKKATKAEIRAAYRKKAKSAHPNGGGDRKVWELVKLSHDCLTDDVRRSRYDRTGDIHETEPDNTEQQAMNLAIGALDEVATAIDKQGRNVAEYDIINDAVQRLYQRRQNEENEIAKARAAVKKIRDVGKRFKAKKGKVNRLSVMFEARALDLERQIETRVKQMGITDGAVRFLKEHTFETSAGTVYGRPMIGMNVWSTT